MGSLVGTAALIYSKYDYVPFGLPYWIYYFSSIAAKTFLLISASSVESTTLAILLIIQILLYHLWNEFIQQKYQILGMLTMVAVVILNAVFMFVSGNLPSIGFCLPYEIWCICLLVLSFIHKEEKEPVLPMNVPPSIATPPKIRLNPQNQQKPLIRPIRLGNQ